MWVCGRVGLVGLLHWFMSFKCGFVSLKFRNPQTHIFKLRGLGLAFSLVCGFFLHAKIVKGQPRFLF